MGKNSNHERQEIEEMFRRDKFLNAVEAKAYGLVDEVLGDVSDLVTMLKPAVADLTDDHV
jgi:ATP-dependent Clp protease protease subunit